MSENTTAKRGDLVVVHVTSSTWTADYGRTETEEFSVGVVTSVTRDGMVKRWKRCDDWQERDYLGRPYRGQELPGVGFQKCYVTPAARIDVPGALATAACHVWPTSDFESVMYFGSLDEVREALRPHAGASAAGLREAAATWLAARLAADEASREASAAANRAHAEAGYHTRKGRELRNRLDRAAMDAHSAAIAAANQAYRDAYASVTAPAVAA